MSFESIGSDNENPATQQKVEAVEQCHAEQCELDREILGQSAILPPDAVRFLAQRVRQPEHLSFAIKYAESELVDSSTILSDPDIRDAVLIDCIETAAIEFQRDREKLADVGGKRETVASLRAQINGNLSGPDKAEKLSQLIQSVRGSTDFSEAEREATLKHLTQIAAQLSQIRQVAATPAETTVINQILATASLNLGAGSNFEVFGEALTKVENSDQISEETKANIRTSIGMPQVNTGSQAQDILRETRVDEKGRTVPVWTEKQPLNIRDGVSMHSDPNMRQIMRTEFNGHITEIDTTGWSGEVVGKYLEAMSFVRDVESYGGTGLFQSIYKIDFNLTGEEGFDAHKVDQILNIMGKWFGGFEHADGDVRQNGERRGFIRYVVRLLNKRSTATGFEESQADSNEVLTELGLRNKDGSPNWLQIDRMGDFARSTYMSGDADFEDLKAHLVGGETGRLNDGA